MKKFLALGLLLVAPLTYSQELPPITFGASVTNANGQLNTTLMWEAPGYESCVGSGHPAWNGDHPPSGSLALPTITMSGTYPLTITCVFPDDRTARLSWAPPTENTDGSALVNLAEYSIHWGRTSSDLSQVRIIGLDEVVPDPNRAGNGMYILEDLEEGRWFFAVRARNSLGVESDLSNVVDKVITLGGVQTSSVSLTVNPIPRAVSVVVD